MSASKVVKASIRLPKGVVVQLDLAPFDPGFPFNKEIGKFFSQTQSRTESTLGVELHLEIQVDELKATVRALELLVRDITAAGAE